LFHNALVDNLCKDTNKVLIRKRLRLFFFISGYKLDKNQVLLHSLGK